MSNRLQIQDFSVVPEAARKPVWHNGRLVDWHDALFHVETHVINYGSGVFEGIRIYDTKQGPAIFHLDAHLRRLARSMQLFHIKCPYSLDQIRQGCIEVAKASAAQSGYLRAQVQFGLSTLALRSIDVIDATTVFWPMGKYRDVEKLSIGTSKLHRLSPKAFQVEAKVTGYYTNSHYNRIHAMQQGWDDAIMLDDDGNVAEASVTNIFYVKDGHIVTPTTGAILVGITRNTILELAAHLDIAAHEKTVTIEDLESADEIFLTGTAVEIEPVIYYGDRPVGTSSPGPVTRRLQEAFQKTTRGQLESFGQWLTFIT